METQEPITLRRQIEEIIEFQRELELENINIAGQEYKLKVTNANGILGLEFHSKRGKDYDIIINRDGIRFSRFFYIASDNDCGYESLQIRVDDSRPGPKKGKILWLERAPYKGEGYETFYVPFGPNIE